MRRFTQAAVISMVIGMILPFAGVPVQAGHAGAPGGGGLDGWVDAHGDTMHGPLAMEDRIEVGAHPILFDNGALQGDAGGGPGLRFAGERVCLANQDISGCADADDVITSVTAGDGLTGGAESGDATLAVQACTAEGILKHDGSSWTCGVDQDTLYDGSDFALSDQSCASGDVVTGVDASGDVVCGEVATVDAWVLGGNANTTVETDFLGTTDLTSLVLKVNGTQAFSLVPTDGRAPNVVGGDAVNTAADEAEGATVGGGGTDDLVVFGTSFGARPNTVTDVFATVGGGVGNTAGDGDTDPESARFSTVGGGRDNTASGGNAVVGGGRANTASGSASTVGGGFQNTAGEAVATIAGGSRNTASGRMAAVGGGIDNSAHGQESAIGGGDSNVAKASEATVAGGGGNTASGFGSAVGGGHTNTAGGWRAFVGAGLDNAADGREATIGGGRDNVATGWRGTIAGGHTNTASGQMAAVGGGFVNVAGGAQSTVPGGSRNEASGDFSFAAGAGATADHDGAFVWSDHTETTGNAFVSTGEDQFLINATGGVGIGTNSPTEQLDVDGKVEFAAGALCVDDDADCTPPADGEIDADAFNSPSSDLAEVYPSMDELEPAEVVTLDRDRPGHVERTAESAQPGPLLVVSTDPGLLLGAPVDEALEEAGLVSEARPTVGDTRVVPGTYPIALSGRVPVQATAENGPIRVGDPLTSSSVPGTAMRAPPDAPVLGVALEPLEQAHGTIEAFVTSTGPARYGPSGLAPLHDELADQRQQIQALQEENADLRDRLDRLSSRLDQLEEAVDATSTGS